MELLDDSDEDEFMLDELDDVLLLELLLVEPYTTSFPQLVRNRENKIVARASLDFFIVNY